MGSKSILKQDDPRLLGTALRGLRHLVDAHRRPRDQRHVRLALLVAAHQARGLLETAHRRHVHRRQGGHVLVARHQLFPSIREHLRLLRHEDEVVLRGIAEPQCRPMAEASDVEGPAMNRPSSLHNRSCRAGSEALAHVQKSSSRAAAHGKILAAPLQVSPCRPPEGISLLACQTAASSS